MFYFANKLFTSISWERLAVVHPRLLCVLLTIAIPLGILATIFLVTFIVMAPMGFLMGWL